MKATDGRIFTARASTDEDIVPDDTADCGGRCPGRLGIRLRTNYSDYADQQQD